MTIFDRDVKAAAGGQPTMESGSSHRHRHRLDAGTCSQFRAGQTQGAVITSPELSSYIFIVVPLQL